MKTSILAAATFVLLFTLCSRPTQVSGGSTTTDNASVRGKVFSTGGLPAKGAAVRLRTRDYVRPLGTAPDTTFKRDTVVDDSGGFVVDSLRKGDYRIEINDAKTAALMLRCSVATFKDSIALPDDTLRPYTAIAGNVDSSELKKAPLFVQIEGTDRLVRIDSLTGAFSVADLPPATYTVRIISADASFKPVVIDSVVTDTGVTQVVIDTTKINTVKSSLSLGPWIRTNGPNVSSVKCIAVSPSGDIFAGTNGGGAFRSTDKGATWIAINSGLSNAFVQCLAVGPGNNSLYAGTQNELFYSADGGASWTAITNHLSLKAIMDIRAVVVGPDGLGGTVIFAGTKDNGIFKSNNNGASWTVINTGKLTDATFIKSLAVVSTGTERGIVFAGTDGGIFRSSDNGSIWTQVNSGLTDQGIECLFATHDGKKLFAGTFSGVFASADSGGSWTLLSIGQNINYINAIAVGGIEGPNIFAASYGDGIFRSTDNGATWTLVNTGLTSVWVNALAANGTDIFLGADYDGMFMSQDNGASWTGVNNGLTNVDVNVFVAGGAQLFAGTSRGVFLSTDNGLSWKESDSGLVNHRVSALARMSGATGVDKYFAASGDGAFISTDNGSFWKAINGTWTTISIDAIAVVGSTVFVGAGNGGSTVDHGVFASSDDGATWTQASAGFPNKDSLGITAFAVDSNGTGVISVFAGTTTGGIFRSTNKGGSWVAVNSGLSTSGSLIIHTIAISRTGKTGAMVMAGTDDGLLISVNNGDIWAAANTGLPTYPLVISLAAAQQSSGNSLLFVGTSGGPSFFGVYISTDNGASWTTMNSGLPNVAPYTLFVNGQTLFAGLQGSGVWKSLIQ
jgi:hypothetical protein